MDLKMSCTLPARDDLLVIGGQLSSGSSNYQVQSFLGQGTFGKVVKCTRMKDMKTVAIKMIRDEGWNIDWTKKEVSTLVKLRPLDSDKSNLVRWYQAFTYRGHTCLEFEYLEKSLSDFMKERHFRPLHLKEIRPIVQQLANALNHLRVAKIIHADLKLENVMLVNHAQEPYRVRLIDFGLAMEFSDTKLGSYIQSRPYRSPEVILGYAFTEAIDMWSLGCLAASLYLGTLLFPGKSEYDMMRYITETLGQPPDLLLGYGCKTHMFFQRVDNCPTSHWKLKTPEQFHRETGIQPQETRKFKLSSLKDLLRIRNAVHDNLADKVAEMSDLLMFVDMLEGMLYLDDHKRYTPRQVLEHPFIRMSHMVDLYKLSSHVKSCFQIMDVCGKTQTSEAGKAAYSSLQQPSSRTAQPIPVHSTAVRRPPAQHADSSKSSQTQSCIKKGLKRKMADGEDVGRQQNNSDRHKRSQHDVKRSRKSDAGPSASCSSSRTHDQSYTSPKLKRKLTQDADSDNYEMSGHKKKRVRKSDAGPSTSSSSQGCSNNIHVSTAVRRPPAQNADTSRSSQTQSCIRQGCKRKMADDEDVGHQQTHEDVKRVRESDAGPSTSSSSQGCSNNIHVSTAVRRPPAQNADTSRNSQTQSCIRQGCKRKMADDEDVGRQQTHENVKRVRESDAGPSTSCSSSRTQSSISSKAERRLTPKEDSGHERSRDRKSDVHVRPAKRSNQSEHHCHRTEPASSSRTMSQAWFDLKRAANDGDAWKKALPRRRH